MQDAAHSSATDTPAPRPAPCGTWPSSISAAQVAAGARPLAAPRPLADGRVCWLEGLPQEGGRVVIVEAAADGTRRVRTPAGFNVRSRVHEYGGGAYAAQGDTLWFSHFGDHRVYEQVGDAAPRALTPEGLLRHADVEPDLVRRRLIAVCEDHGTPVGQDHGATSNPGDVTAAAHAEPANRLVAIALDGLPAAPRVLAEGADFYAAPRLSPDGRQLAWLQWRHPHMPWQSTELWLAEVAADGSLAGARCIAGAEGRTALVQPQWSPAGVLHVVSDASGWWNLQRVHLDAQGRATLQPVWATEAEFGRPMWVFGQCSYGFLEEGLILAAAIHQGRGRLWRIDGRAEGSAASTSPRIEEIELPVEDYGELRVGHGQVIALAGSPTRPEAVLRLGPTLLPQGTAVQVLAQSVDAVPAAEAVSVARPVSYPGPGGHTVHAFHYPPSHPHCTVPAGEAPPLLVFSHGGPTSMTVSTLRLMIQFWTNRGFAVLDVNYGGSTGFGRPYRERLSGQWGVVDVEDCVAGARWLAAQGLADPARMAIRGGSAGGYTTLCALAFHEVFKAGASWYGVGDLRALDADTHKFESRYTLDLLGPPERRERLYAERSPIAHAARITCPVILFQGLDDKVVPPAQSEAMVTALKAKGLRVAYRTFEGEGHGFRRRETLEAALQAELAFYAAVFGFTPATAPGEATAEVPWV